MNNSKKTITLIAFTLILPFTTLMAQNSQIGFNDISQIQEQFSLTADFATPLTLHSKETTITKFDISIPIPERPDVPVLEDEIETEQEPISIEDSTPNTFIEPSYNRDLILLNYPHLDPGKKVPLKLLEKALTYYKANLSKIKNKKYLSIIDFTKHSSKARFFIIDMESGKVKAIHVAHGKYSDPDADGYATSFSNTTESKKSSLGFYATAEIYYGKHGRSMRLDGLSSTNSNARRRAVVIHAANYVREDNVQAGRSYGCPAVNNSMIGYVLDKLHGGSIIYADLSGTY